MIKVISQKILLANRLKLSARPKINSLIRQNIIRLAREPKVPGAVLILPT